VKLNTVVTIKLSSVEFNKWNKNCVLLGYYAACSGNYLPTFRDNISFQFSRVKNPRRCSHLLRGGSL